MNRNPSQEWRASLNSTLNRLSNQYLTLLRAASSEMALEDIQIDQRGEWVRLNAHYDSVRSGAVHFWPTYYPSLTSTYHCVKKSTKAGGHMKLANEPPPPLAASTTLSTLTTSVATENICTSVNSLLDLIRIMRLSVTVMGEERSKEEEMECWEDGVVMEAIWKETVEIGNELKALLTTDEWC